MIEGSPGSRGLRIPVWHVHGSWTTAFVQGPHTYLLPATAEGGPWGRGRCGRDWPDSTQDIAPEDLACADIELVIVRRPEEIGLTENLLKRRLGRDVPAVYVEHNTPRGDVPETRHAMAGRADIPMVQVTHFNALMWDCGLAPTVVIEHGVVDPGERYTGDLRRAAVVINEPVRRCRVTGTDLLPVFARVAPLDVFGRRLDGLAEKTGLDTGADNERRVTDRLATAMARRRLYLQTPRWTSLGLALIEAMHFGMPVVAVASTEAARAVPPEAGVVSADLGELTMAVHDLLEEPEEARRRSKYARESALRHYGLGTFLDRWQQLFDRMT
jgi:glycosyltransferase involved in cell wall biosynthesis